MSFLVISHLIVLFLSCLLLSTFCAVIQDNWKKSSRNKKVCQVAVLPVPLLYTPKAVCISFGMWGHVWDAVIHAKFKLNRFRGFGAPGGRKSLSVVDWRYRPYNSVLTNVLHCDIGLSK